MWAGAKPKEAHEMRFCFLSFFFAKGSIWTVYAKITRLLYLFIIITFFFRFSHEKYLWLVMGFDCPLAFT